MHAKFKFVIVACGLIPLMSRSRSAAQEAVYQPHEVILHEQVLSVEPMSGCAACQPSSYDVLEPPIQRTPGASGEPQVLTLNESDLQALAGASAAPDTSQPAVAQAVLLAANEAPADKRRSNDDEDDDHDENDECGLRTGHLSWNAVLALIQKAAISEARADAAVELMETKERLYRERIEYLERELERARPMRSAVAVPIFAPPATMVPGIPPVQAESAPAPPTLQESQLPRQMLPESYNPDPIRQRMEFQERDVREKAESAMRDARAEVEKAMQQAREQMSELEKQKRAFEEKRHEFEKLRETNERLRHELEAQHKLNEKLRSSSKKEK